MPTAAQTQAAKKNIKKARTVWQEMSSRARARAQPEGHGREKPGATGEGEYYHIEVRPKGQFTTFRTHDVGEKGGILRVGGKRSSGSWDDQKWLISKEHAHVEDGKLVPDSEEAREVLEALGSEPVHIQLDHDFVVVHDPQPLPLITHFRKKGPWIWRCHLDLSCPHPELWHYLTSFIEQYDAVILTLKEYAQALQTPQVFFLPAIDPFSVRNRTLNNEDMDERLRHYGIPTDLPLVVQISRFDRWKDPEGVIQAFRLARQQVPCTLVLLGNVATDDPEGPKVYESLLRCREDRVLILSHQDTALVNALQSRAAVVLQKSLREGFGLTVTEALWAGTPVIGGNVGGIRAQLEDGVNGFLVSSVAETAERIVQLLTDKELRTRLGQRARQTVRERFLLTRLLEDYLDLFNAFEARFHLRTEGRVTEKVARR